MAICFVLATPVPVLTPTPVPSLHTDFPFAPPIAKPTIRVGFDLPEGPIALSVTRGSFTIHEPGNPAALWTDRAVGGVMLVVDGVDSGAPLMVKRVQIGTFRSEAHATELANRLAGEWQVAAGASWDSSRNVWRVRMGEADTAEGLFELLRQAREGGYPDAWIVSEPRRSLKDATLKLLDSRWNSFTTTAGRLLFLPQEGARLTVAGKTYRGLIEARLSPFGEVQVINELPLEFYLRGVVPLELGPVMFPELDALKAQAIAARTYAMANLGQFVDEGFDTCDTPRCQVYGGASAEHPLSDRAVRETDGELLIHESKPINALFTATCGGHTENVEVVFPEWRGPYLRGVPCYAETKDLKQAYIEVRGSALPHSISEEPSDGRVPLLRAAAIAAAILPQAAEESTWRAGPVGESEFLNWMTRLARAAGRAAPVDGPRSTQRLELWRSIARWMGLIEGAKVELLPGDEQVLVMSADRGDIPEQEWGWLAGLIEQGYLAVTYRKAKEYSKALELHAVNVQLARETLGPTNDRTLQYLREWIGALEDDKQYAAAIEKRYEVLAIERKTLPADDPKLASALEALGKTMLLAERFADAEPVLRESLTIREKKFPGDWYTFRIQSSLGGALLGQKKHTEALPLLEAGYTGMKDRLKSIPTASRDRLTEAVDRLIDHANRTNDTEAQVRWEFEKESIK